MHEEKIVMSETKGRRNYQDSVFRLLFSDKESAVELFNALEGTDYGPDTEVRFTTLEDALYQGVKNDLGFVIDNRFIVLTEHQSVRSDNLPMRQLQYIARTFETMVDSRALFRSGLVKIPTPEFFVIYTGKEAWDVEELRLSASFNSKAPENSLELVVKIIKVVYNGDDEEIKKNEVLQRSAKLRGYGILLHYVRTEAESGKDLKEAIDAAVARCQREDILTTFLRTHSAEVGTMLYDDITREEFLEIRAEEARETGFAQGLEAGRQAGLEAGVLQGRIAELIEYSLEDGKTQQQIIAKLRERFDLDEDAALEYFEKHKGKYGTHDSY